MHRRAFLQGVASLALAAACPSIAQADARHYFLSPYRGRGTLHDPFRPLGGDRGRAWASIDLRPDPTRRVGWALFSTLDRRVPSGAHYLGNDPDTFSVAARRHLASALGVSLAGSRLRQIIPEILLVHCASRRGLCRPLRPTATGRYEIYLGDLFWASSPTPDDLLWLPVALPASDAFTRGDESPIGGNWTNAPGAGQLALAATQITVNVAATTGTAFWNADAFNDNQYAELTYVTEASPAVRIRNTVQWDAYFTYLPSSGTASIYKTVGGSNTELTTPNHAYGATDVHKIDANGTLITLYKNGVSVGSPATDSALTSGSAGAWIAVGVGDSWAGGNLAAASGQRRRRVIQL